MAQRASTSNSFEAVAGQNPGSILSYEHLGYEVKTSEGRKALIDDVSVDICAGELLAIMGPSGAGKSTLLDLMSFRKPMKHDGSVHLNGQRLDAAPFHKISSFVEQEDALLGVLTVRESISFALRLHLPLLSRKEALERVERVIQTLGLQSCAEQRIGTPISRGISGGQKRRVTAACAMVAFPRILFLDEVTSGLDSTSAREVMSSIRALAISERMIVIASIHQPSLETLAQFTNVMFLSEGQLCYYGKVGDLEHFFEKWGRPVGKFSTPAEHAMNFLNEDFASSQSSTSRIGAREFREFFRSLPSSQPKDNEKHQLSLTYPGDPSAAHGSARGFSKFFWNVMVLSERSVLNYSRNLLAYGVRAGMYAGMGLMLATIWIRLGNADSTINDRLSVHFYSVAFLAFMSVAGIPSFLEERAVYYRETKNGLYTTLPFVLANTLVNVPFLFLCTLFFSVICYWAIGLHPGGAHFFRFLGFLFIAIVAAESQALVVAALLPIFVAALAISAFINGFWMSVGGYFIKSESLPRFWYYSFHYMDYQRYAFELLVNSDFRGLTFKCATKLNDQCVCAYPSSTPSTCTVSGEDVLNYLKIGGISYGQWAAIAVSITIIYRIALYFALRARSS
ncbi:P-loop containing nucleoside triphosphate hydrolase protein [Crepidotus variabilis]|uniref:P-loop containing nucleoside triphosphate hydrolase protein n=1 Tax=Crepidotus variabilis TaxID=179855 RepID=A0A9P6JJD9_9AGAR|nr:P-loop containing nucleoside triphosphate hydrolase protein [Crepidotus variabilis]